MSGDCPGKVVRSSFSVAGKHIIYNVAIALCSGWQSKPNINSQGDFVTRIISSTAPPVDFTQPTTLNTETHRAFHNLDHSYLLSGTAAAVTSKQGMVENVKKKLEKS